MTTLEWVAVVLGIWTIAALVVVALCIVADEDRYPTPKCPRRYVAPGDDLYNEYRSWGGKGRKF